jgi:hypothetical protein
VSPGRNGSALDRLVAELETPVARLGGDGWKPDREWCAARLRELLSRAELRAWRVEQADEPGVLLAGCPLEGGRALLAYARAPNGTPVPGAFVVGRSVPFGPRRYLLIGRATVVAHRHTTDFAALLGSLRAPRGEFWGVHGAVIARAARAWAATPPAAVAERRAA